MPSSSFFDYSDNSSDSRSPSSYETWRDKYDYEQSQKQNRKDRPAWQQAAFNTLMSKTYGTDKWQDYAKGSDRPYFGDWSRGGGGQVLDNLGVVYPQQQGPIYIPGVETRGSGGGGLFGDIGSAAGLIGTAAGFFGPLGAPIGALAGRFIDRAVG